MPSARHSETSNSRSRTDRATRTSDSVRNDPTNQSAKRKEVFIVGDSILKNLQGQNLSRSAKVKVSSFRSLVALLWTWETISNQETMHRDFWTESSNKRKTSIQLDCALNNLSKEMFFDLIRSVLFEKRLSCVFIEMHWFKLTATAGRLLGIRSCREITSFIFEGNVGLTNYG